MQESQCATIAMGAGDVPFVAFNARVPRSGAGEVRQVVRRLNGATWQTVREIQATNFTDRIQVIADSAGRPVIVWSAIAPGSDHRLNVERFNGTGWDLRASGFGSQGGQGVGDYRIAMRPDGELVIATVTGFGAGGNAIVAFRVNDNGASVLGDSTTLRIDQTFDSNTGVAVLDVAASATETVVSYSKGGPNSFQARTSLFNEAANRWDVVGSEADQVSRRTDLALAFQGGMLVQVASGVDSVATQARRWDGTRWSAFTSLQPVSSLLTRAAVRQDTLFIVYTERGAPRAGVARLNVP
jgi:hypothetical protein